MSRKKKRAENEALDGLTIGKHITFYKRWSYEKRIGERYKKLPHKKYVFFIDDFFIYRNGEWEFVYWDKHKKKLMVGNDPDPCGWFNFGICCSIKKLKKEILAWNFPAGLYARIWGDLVGVVALIKK